LSYLARTLLQRNSLKMCWWRKWKWVNIS